VLLGAFCHRCGERQPDPRRDRLSEYALAPLRAIGSLDGRWLRAMWSLVRRPGELSSEWARGARVRWPRPWSVFFLVNVAY
jgi:hypothetical protein